MLEALAELSGPILLRRALYGWNVAPDALMREPAGAVEERARALVSHADLAPFSS